MGDQNVCKSKTAFVPNGTKTPSISSTLKEEGSSIHTHLCQTFRISIFITFRIYKTGIDSVVLANEREILG